MSYIYTMVVQIILEFVCIPKWLLHHPLLLLSYMVVIYTSSNLHGVTVEVDLQTLRVDHVAAREIKLVSELFDLTEFVLEVVKPHL